MGNICKALICLAFVAAGTGHAQAQENPASPGNTNPEWIPYNHDSNSIDPGEYYILFREVGTTCISDTMGIEINLLEQPAAPVVQDIIQPTCVLATGSVVLSGLPEGEWIINPGSISGSGSTSTITELVAGQSYTFTVTASNACNSPSSEEVSIIPTPLVPEIPTANLTQTFCAGSLVSSLEINGQLPSGTTLLWYTTSQGGTALATSTELVSGTYYAAAVSTDDCESARLPVNVTVNPLIPPAVSITANKTEICEGDEVTFTAEISEGVSEVNYQWYLNDEPTGDNSSTFTRSNLNNGYEIYCSVTTTGTCIDEAPQNSNVITIEISPKITFTINDLTTCGVITGNIALTGLDANKLYEYLLLPEGTVGSTANSVVIGGETYNTVTIGSQTWLQRNLHYNDGAEGIYSYNDNTSISDEYGYLYTWDAAMRVANNVEGWHLPNHYDFTVFLEFLNINYGMQFSECGGLMKEEGYEHWNTPNQDATNEFGLTALGGGYYNWESGYVFIKSYGYWWRAEEHSVLQDYALCYNLSSNGHEFRAQTAGLKINGYSVRLIKDSSSTSSSDWQDYKSSIENLEQGNYNILVREKNTTCVSNPVDFTITLKEIPLATITTNAENNTICAGESIILTANDADSYLWGTGETTQSIIVSPDQSTSYTLRVEKNACASEPSEISIHVNPLFTPKVSIIAEEYEICEGQSVAFTATPTHGGANPSYEWFIGDVKQAGFTGNEFIAYNNTENFTVHVKMTPGSDVLCVSGDKTASAEQSIQVNTLPILSVMHSECSPDRLSYSLSFTSDGEVTANFGVVDNANKTVSNIPVGQTVTLTATSLEGCQTTLEYESPVCPCPYIAAPVSPDHQNICNGDAFPELSVSLAEGLSANWYDELDALVGEKVLKFTPDEAGTYYVKAFDPVSACESEASAPFSIVVHDLPDAPFAEDQSFCAGSLVSGLVAEYPQGTELHWYASIVDDTYLDENAPLNTGSYFAVSLSTQGCESERLSVDVTVNPLVTASVILAADKTEICENDEVVFTATPTNGGTNPSYEWFIGNVKQDGFTGNEFIAYNNTKNFTVHVKMTPGSDVLCISGDKTASAEQSIQVNILPILSVLHSECSPDRKSYTVYFDTDGQLAANYGVVDNANKTVSNIPLGQTVTLTATSLDGCITALEYESPSCPCPFIAAPVGPGHQNICSGDAFPELSVSLAEGHTAKWYNSQDVLIWDNSLPFKSRMAGTYYVKAFDPVSGCESEASAPFSIVVHDLPDAPFAEDQSFCAGSLVSGLVAEYPQGTELHWYASIVDDTYLDENIPLNTGTYFAASLNTEGCESERLSVDVTINQLVTASVILAADKTEICEGQSVAFTATPTQGGTNPTYEWFIGDVKQEGFTGNVFTADNQTENFTVHVKMTSNAVCVEQETVSSGSVEVLVNQLPTLETTDITLPCYNGTADLSSAIANIEQLADGIVIRYYSNGDEKQLIENYTALGKGSYSIEAVSEKGCKVEKDVMIIEPGQIVIDAIVQKHPDCNGYQNGIINIRSISGGTGAITFTVNDSEPNAWNNASYPFAVAAGIYNIVASDANACNASVSLTVTDPELLTISAQSVDHVKCIGGNNGSLMLTITGGTGPDFYFKPYNAPITPTLYQPGGHLINNLYAGSYIYEASDSKGCKALMEEAVVIETGNEISASVVNTVDIECLGDNSGSVLLNVNNTKHKQLYYKLSTSYDKFDANGNQVLLENLSTGNYNVLVYDDNFCTKSVPVVIKNDLRVTFEIYEPTNARCNITVNDGYVRMRNASGGIGDAYTYTVNNGQTWHTYYENGQSIGLAPGNHRLLIKDSDGCRSAYSNVFTIVRKENLSITYQDPKGVSCYGDTDGSVKITAINGTGGYDYKYAIDDDAVGDINHSSWLPIPNDNVIRAFKAGNNTIYFSDAIGCGTGVMSANISTPAPLEFGEIAYKPRCDSEGNPIVKGIDLSALTGGTPTYYWKTTTDINWDELPNDKVIVKVPESRSFTIMVKDANGCVLDKTFNALNTNTEALKFYHQAYNPFCATSLGYDKITDIEGGSQKDWEYKLNDDEWVKFNRLPRQINGLAIGTHDIQIKDGAGCIAPVQSFYMEPSGDLNVDYSKYVPASCSGMLGSITINNVNGEQRTGLFYSMDKQNWLPLVYPAKIEGLTTGKHTLYIKEKGCVFEVTSMEVPKLYDPITLTQKITQPECANQKGSVLVYNFKSVGKGNFYYSWNNESWNEVKYNTLTKNNIIGGTHYLTIKDTINDNGTLVECVSKDFLIPIDIVLPVTFNAYIDSSDCKADGYKLIVSNPSGGAGKNYEYRINDSSPWKALLVADTVKSVHSGNYPVTVKNGTCIATKAIKITTDRSKIAYETVKPAYLCNGNKEPVIIKNISGGCGIGYQVKFGNNPWQVYSTSFETDSLYSGRYAINIRDKNECIIKDTIVIEGAAEPLKLAIGDVYNSIGEQNNGKLYINSISGGSGEGYLIKNNNNTFTLREYDQGYLIENLPPGKITLTVSDSKDCSSEAYEINIGSNEPLSAVLAHYVPSCIGNDRLIKLISKGNDNMLYSYSKESIATGFDQHINASVLKKHQYLYVKSGIDTLSIKVLDCPLLANTISGSGADKEMLAILGIAGGYGSGYKYAVNGGGKKPFNIGGAYVNTDSISGSLCSLSITDEFNSRELAHETHMGNNVRPSFEHRVSEVLYYGQKAELTVNNIKGGSGNGYKYVLNTQAYEINGTDFKHVDLDKGTYRLNLVDGTGCESLPVFFTIEEPAGPKVVLSIASEVTCKGFENAVLNTTVYGVDPNSDKVFKWFEKENNEWIPLLKDGNTLSEIGAGTYKVDLLIGNESVAIDSITVAEPDMLELNYSVDNVLCFGVENGQVKLSASGGFGGYQYAFNDSVFTPNSVFDSLAVGNYYASVKDGNGCVSLLNDIIVTSPETKLSHLISIVKEPVGNGFNGSIQVLVSGGSTPHSNYFYNESDQIIYPTRVSLNDNSTFFYYNYLKAGKYRAVSFDKNSDQLILNGCMAEDSIDLENSNPVVIDQVQFVHPSCYGLNNGSISFVPGGGKPFGGSEPYLTEWRYMDQNGNVELLSHSLYSLENAGAGYYIVTVSDSVGAKATRMINIAGPPELLVEAFEKNDIGCFNDNNGSATWSVSGGSAPYQYALNGSVVNQATASNLTPKAYNLLVTDTKGCTVERNFEIVGPSAPLAISLTGINSTNSELPDGSITVDIAGGSLPYSVKLFNTGQNTNVLVNEIVETDRLSLQFENLPNAKYLVEVSDKQTNTINTINFCTVENSIELFETEQMLVTASLQKPVSCLGDTDAAVRVDITGPTNLEYSYSWFKLDKNMLNKLNKFEQVLTAVGAGIYVVEVTADIGFSGSDTIEVLNPDNISISTLITPVACINSSTGSIAATVEGGTAPYSYLWSDGQTTSDAINLASGRYSITVTDIMGCSASANNINIDQPNNILSISIDKLDYPGSSTSTDGSIQITVKNGWKNNSSVDIVWYSRYWDSIASNVTKIQNLKEDIYHVVVTETYNSSNGAVVKCVAEESFLLLSKNSYHVVIDVDGNLDCNGSGTMKFTSKVVSSFFNDNEFDFQWFKLNGDQYESIGSSKVSNGNTVGTYKLELNPKQKLIKQGVEPFDTIFTIENPAPLEIDPMVQSVTCNGGADGKVNGLNVSGGRAPYTYLWDHGPTSTHVDGLEAKEYKVHVTDKRNCVKEFTIKIPQPEPLSVELVNAFKPSGYGKSDGIFDIRVKGGTSPYTGLWYNPAGDLVADSIDAGGLSYSDYTVSITDANNCKVTETFNFGNPPLFIRLDTEQQVLCANEPTGALSLFIDGGTPLGETTPYRIEWFILNESAWNGLIPKTKALYNLLPGEYKVQVSDASDTLTAFAKLENGVSFVVTLDTEDTNCDGNTGKLTATVIGPDDDYQYRWTVPGIELNYIDELEKGFYGVTVTNSAGCSVFEFDEIYMSGTLGADPVLFQPTCSSAPDGAISLNISGGSENYAFVWDADTTFRGADIVNARPGTYKVFVADLDENCSYNGQFVLDEPTPPLAFSQIDEEIFLCNGQQITLEADPGEDDLNFQWWSGTDLLSDLNTCTFNSEGTYTYQVTQNTTACVWAKNIEVSSVAIDIDAQFLSATHIYPGDELVLVNTSTTVADSIRWVMSTDINITAEDAGYCTITTEVPGEYTIQLIIYMGNCTEVFNKTVVVLDQEKPDELKALFTSPLIISVIASPNPSDGNFNLEIILDRESPLFIRMYHSVSSYVHLSEIVQAVNLEPYSDDDFRFQKQYMLGNLRAGIYIISVLTPTSENAVMKITIE